MELLIIKSVLLGIIEGVTEFAPVSSTAHLLIAGKVFGGFNPEFLKVFSVGIQSGAMLAVIAYFWKTVWKNLSLIPKVIVGFIPTAVAGFLLKKIVSLFLGNTALIAWALIIGGVILLFIKTKDIEHDIKNISYREAFLIGLSQIAAFIPGVSRSGATLIGGTLLGLSRSTIAPFSFLLGVPTILAASVLEIHTLPQLQNGETTLLLCGTATAFIVSLFVMKPLIKLLTQKPLSWFGWYRIALGTVVLLCIL